MSKDELKHRNGRRKALIMSPEDVKSGKQSHWEELEINGTIRNLSPAIWHLTHLTALFLNDNQLTRIPAEISRLQKLHCLDLSSNKLRSLPAEIGDLVQLRELMLNHNSLRLLPYEIGKLFNLHILGLAGNPLQPEILSLYKSGTPHLLTYLLDNLAVTCSEPPEREWVHSNHPERTGNNTAIFSVMSYNVLCDKYATRQLYGYCPPWALNWEYRRKIIMREITYYSADIIALQEIETCEYHSFFTPELKANGYDGIFSPKSRAKHMADEDKQHVDGCAIFWKTSKFSLVKEHLVEFNQVAMQNNEGSKDMLNRVMTKDNIGIAALLETTEGLYENSGFPTATETPRQLVLAVNAHMHWDPEFSDVKLIQTVMLCSELKRLCDESSQSFRPGGRTSAGAQECHKFPVVLCGDFNSLPDSGVVEYLQTGKVSNTHVDFKDIQYSKTLSALANGLRSNGTLQREENPKNICHPFRLNSCYDKDTFHKLKYSNHTFDFKGIIDYIFYSRTRLRCLGVLGGIDQDWFKRNNIVGCPHPHIPSDHISLVTEFQLIPSEDLLTGERTNTNGVNNSSSNAMNNGAFSNNPSRNGTNSSPLSYQGPIWAASAPHTRFPTVINGTHHPSGNHLPSGSPSAGRPGSANMHSPTNNGSNGVSLMGMQKNGRR